MVLAAGKFLISEETQNKKFEVVKVILEAIAGAIKAPASGSVDTKRLALVVVRTISRVHFEVSLIESSTILCISSVLICIAGSYRLYSPPDLVEAR